MSKITINMPQDLIAEIQKTTVNISKYINTKIKIALEEDRAKKLTKMLHSIKPIKCDKTAVEITRECRDED